LKTSLNKLVNSLKAETKRGQSYTLGKMVFILIVAAKMTFFSHVYLFVQQLLI